MPNNDQQQLDNTPEPVYFKRAQHLFRFVMLSFLLLVIIYQFGPLLFNYILLGNTIVVLFLALIVCWLIGAFWLIKSYAKREKSSVSRMIYAIGYCFFLALFGFFLMVIPGIC